MKKVVLFKYSDIHRTDYVIFIPNIRKFYGFSACHFPGLEGGFFHVGRISAPFKGVLCKFVFW
jgi:hypothetical protein